MRGEGPGGVGGGPGAVGRDAPDPPPPSPGTTTNTATVTGWWTSSATCSAATSEAGRPLLRFPGLPAGTRTSRSRCRLPRGRRAPRWEIKTQNAHSRARVSAPVTTGSRRAPHGDALHLRPPATAPRLRVWLRAGALGPRRLRGPAAGRDVSAPAPAGLPLPEGRAGRGGGKWAPGPGLRRQAGGG